MPLRVGPTLLYVEEFTFYISGVRAMTLLGHMGMHSYEDVICLQYAYICHTFFRKLSVDMFIKSEHFLNDITCNFSLEVKL